MLDEIYLIKGKNKRFDEENLQKAKQILDNNLDFKKRSDYDYRSKNKAYIGFFSNSIQVIRIKKSLLESIIDILEPEFFTTSTFKDRPVLYPIEHLHNLYSGFDDS